MSTNKQFKYALVVFAVVELIVTAFVVFHMTQRGN